MNSNRFITALFALFTILAIGCGNTSTNESAAQTNTAANNNAEVKVALPAEPNTKDALTRVSSAANSRIDETLAALAEMKTKNEDNILEYRLQNNKLDNMVMSLRSLKDAVTAEQKAVAEYDAAVQARNQQNVAKSAELQQVVATNNTAEAPSAGVFFYIIIIVIVLLVIFLIIRWVLSPSEDNMDDDDEFDFDDEFFDDEDDDFLDDDDDQVEDADDASKKKADDKNKTDK